MVPVGELPEASVAEIVEAVIALPLVPLVGAVAESVVDVKIGVSVNGPNVPAGRVLHPLVLG
jgi:hypothetical protein